MAGLTTDPESLANARSTGSLKELLEGTGEPAQVAVVIELDGIDGHHAQFTGGDVRLRADCARSLARSVPGSTEAALLWLGDQGVEAILQLAHVGTEPGQLAAYVVHSSAKVDSHVLDLGLQFVADSEAGGATPAVWLAVEPALAAP